MLREDATLSGRLFPQMWKVISEVNYWFTQLLQYKKTGQIPRQVCSGPFSPAHLSGEASKKYQYESDDGLGLLPFKLITLTCPATGS